MKRIIILLLAVFISACAREHVIEPEKNLTHPKNFPEILYQKEKNVLPSAPMITYHRVSLATTNDMTVTPQLFRRHMQFLRENKYSPITMDQWCAAVLDGKKLPEKPILITFDDAWKSQYKNAIPILNEYGYKATFYTYTAVVGNKTTMTWKQLRALAEQGHNIGCHSATHSNLAKPFKSENRDMYKARLVRETFNAKRKIEENIGTEVKHFCYPYGYYDTEVILQLKKVGFVSGVTVNPCPNTLDTPLFKLGRFIIGPWVKEKGLKYKLSMLPLNYQYAMPYDGESRSSPTKSISIVLPNENGIHYTKFQMKWKWKKTNSFWDDGTRTLVHIFDRPVKPGIYTVQAHAWDAKSNHYVYAWLFKQKK